MTNSSKKLPQKHDLIIGVVHNITKHGVYVKLKEYENVEGYVHVSEITGAWVRNIRNFVRQDQQIVGRVLRVNPSTNQIDLSIKRVSESLKKDKIAEYKKQNSALALINIISERTKMSIDEIRDLLEEPFINEFGNLYNGFEELAYSGLEVIDFLDIDPKLAKEIHEIAEMSIQVSTVMITADLGIRSFASNGVEQIKKFLKVAETTIKNFPEITSEITTIGSPQYRIHLEGRSYPELTEAYTEIEKKLAEASTKYDIEYRIEQHKK
ncbi:MAG: S1 RNA-binding domain-containing protein [Candidatus Heimdallarchaeota archaeon]|nr:S1 RNA-binding domain-containing protein [Candidatus Heimdallarchaeota archaeon]